MPTELWLTILYNLLEGGKMVLRMRFLNKTFAEAARLHEDNIFPEVMFNDSLFSPARGGGRRVKQKMQLAKDKILERGQGSINTTIDVELGPPQVHGCEVPPC